MQVVNGYMLMCANMCVCVHVSVYLCECMPEVDAECLPQSLSIMFLTELLTEPIADCLH